MKRLILAAIILAGCDRLFHRGTPDAGAAVITPTTTTTTTTTTPLSTGSSLGLHTEDEEDDLDAGPLAVTCPRPIHPDYCRRSCRNYLSREGTMHARRVRNPVRAGVGTCGTYKVFAEDSRADDGGVGGGLVEYFDPATNQLVGAEDSRQRPCGSYGVIPKCKLDITWGAARGGGLSGIK